MNHLYFFIEFTLLSLYPIRFFWYKYSLRKHWNRRFYDILFYYLIFFTNACAGTFKICQNIFFNYLHCSLPVVLSVIIVRQRISVLTLLILVSFVYLNLAIVQFEFIVTTYLILILLIVNKAYRFSLMSKYYRSTLSVYGSIICSIIITQLIFLTSYVKVNWYDSLFVDYFLYLTQFVYLSTIIIGHVYLRRFIVN
jgi:hypothetical protein